MKKILVILIMCVTFSVSAQTYLECTEHNGWEWVDGVIEFYEKNSAGKIERLNNQIDSLRTVINAMQNEEPKEQERTYEKPLTSFNSQDCQPADLREYLCSVNEEQKQKSIRYNIYKLN